MGKCIPQIMLSTGKIVDIPIFSYHTGPETEIVYGGILKVWHEKQGVRSIISKPQFLTDAELIELYSLVYNVPITDIIPGTGFPITTMESYRVVLVFWTENSNGEYTFTIGRLQPSTQQNKLNICNAPVIFQEDFNRSVEPDYGNGGSYCYRAYNDKGVIWYDHDRFNQVVELADYDTDMKEYVEEHYTGSNSRTYCTNIHLSNYTIEATYIEDAVKSEYLSLISGNSRFSYDELYTALTTHAEELGIDIGINIYDNEDPYSYEPATFGGGDGSMGRFNPDGVDPAEVPALPTLSASNIGFMSVYNPSAAQLKSLSQFLWSSAFDIDSFKKLFSDPMQCIIGLGVVPVQPTIGGTKNVTFGDIDSGIGMSYISSEYVEKDMGYVSIDKLYGSFMDYNNTSIQIYLPYIGFRQLQPDDIIGGSIGVVYHINVIDGGCTAYIRHSSRGVLYQYSGSCIANIPLSAINYSGAIQNAVSAALNGVGVVAGIATGAAPVSIMGAAGLVSNAANLALNSKGQVQRSGNVSGSSGLMGIQRPYIIIERARISVPADMHKFVGNTTNMTMNLAQCSGFTIIDHIRMQEFSCTEDEKRELEEILHKGVIF